jgi:hypothetical protein
MYLTTVHQSNKLEYALLVLLILHLSHLHSHDIRPFALCAVNYFRGYGNCNTKIKPPPLTNGRLCAGNRYKFMAFETAT